MENQISFEDFYNSPLGQIIISCPQTTSCYDTRIVDNGSNLSHDEASIKPEEGVKNFSIGTLEHRP